MAHSAVMAERTNAYAPGQATHWAEAIPESRRRTMRVWLWSVAAMTFGVLVVGGITRLTLSGLSIVNWAPLMGVIPPLTDAQWQATFDLYRQFPEYQTWRGGMSMAEFKFIFFWEYLHRLLARGIGVVFLVPFVVFLVRGLADEAAAASHAVAVRAGRDAGRDGLADGGERAGGPAEREPLPAGGAPEPGIRDLRLGGLAGA
jgi:hypothetical protein